MTLQQRISSFSELGRRINNLSEDEFLSLAKQVENNNNWFTPEQTKSALNGISRFLNEHTLKNWLQAYVISDDVQAKSVGLLMAGNIRAVGFHDFMCVLLSGHEAHAKLSSTDQILIKWLATELTSIDSSFGSKIKFEEM